MLHVFLGPNIFWSHTANISSLSTSYLSPKHTVKKMWSMQTTQAPQMATKTNCGNPLHET